MGGFKTSGEVLLTPIALPEEWLVSNYIGILESHSFWQQLLNSILVMLATSIGVVVLASMAAFVFARIRFRGARSSLIS